VRRTQKGDSFQLNISCGGRPIKSSPFNVSFRRTPKFGDLRPLEGWLKKPQSQWKLLYTWTKDGKSNDVFHEKCDNKGSTVTLVRVGGYVFGGYAHLPWSSTLGELGTESQESFLFSLTDGKGRPPSQLLPFQKFEYGLLYYPQYGPVFGGGFDLCLDLTNSTNSCSYVNCTYKFSGQGLAGQPNGWEIEEVEVYLISPS